ncbi:Integral membrane protein CcmA involved in cell shape determination [gamma proteobacterium IMCC2047]|nr:Integral membrane protein CcmA involved in cell shape determination [gamma proteobacterium IMCC2047]
MWNKTKASKSAAKKHSYDTLISSQTNINGDIRFSGGLHIDGEVRGSVVAEPGSKAVVRISDHGVVEGKVRAPHVIINGRVDGDVFSSEHVELAANAVVNGTVHYQLIEMVVGAQVNGSLVHDAADAKAGDSHVEEKQAGDSSAQEIPSASNS